MTYILLYIFKLFSILPTFYYTFLKYFHMTYILLYIFKLFSI